jgi:hypothetical protein
VIVWPRPLEAHSPYENRGPELAAPFRHVFGDTNARERLTENWLLAAGVYLAGGGILAWIAER